MRLLTHTLTALLLFSCTPVFSTSDNLSPFSDASLDDAIIYPSWFEFSSGSLSDDLTDALAEGKTGLIVYFGQDFCPYCEKFLNSLADPDIKNYIQRHYKIIPIDIWGVQDIIDTDGKKYSEHGLANHYETTFTPSLIFYNEIGKPVFRLRGYYPHYRFRAALKYVTEGFYATETFRQYLERAAPGLFFMQGGLTERDFFLKPPYQLNQHRKKILAVFFEQGNCHACDLLHSGPLVKNDTLAQLKKMDVVQLNMWSDTKVTTPQGKTITAIQWAENLGLFYTPTIVFFDETGQEIIRIDSVVEFYRLLGVLNYINLEGYKTEPNYQDWKLKRRKTQ